MQDNMNVKYVANVGAWSVSRPILGKIPLQPLGPTTAPNSVPTQTKLKFVSYPARNLWAYLHDFLTKHYNHYKM